MFPNRKFFEYFFFPLSAPQLGNTESNNIIFYLNIIKNKKQIKKEYRKKLLNILHVHWMDAVPLLERKIKGKCATTWSIFCIDISDKYPLRILDLNVLNIYYYYYYYYIIIIILIINNIKKKHIV